MDHVVNSLNDSYNGLVAAMATLMEAKEAARGERTDRTDRALQAFKESQEMFEAACDRAQEFVESIRQRIGSECMVDEATGPVAAKLAATPSKGGIAPLSAVRLEQLSKAVRWLVLDLQHGATAAQTPGATESDVV